MPIDDGITVCRKCGGKAKDGWLLCSVCSDDYETAWRKAMKPAWDILKKAEDDHRQAEHRVIEARNNTRKTLEAFEKEWYSTSLIADCRKVEQ